MEIKHSQSLKAFKDRIGQSNHFLITLLVGLDALEDNPTISIKDEFRTSWNPKNRNVSILRSREYARNSALSWVVDCLDTYLQSCNIKPKLIQDEEVIKKFDNAGHSVYRKYNEIVKYADVDSILSALVDLGICWRNKLVHCNADNQIQNANRAVLLENASIIKENYCNLDVHRTLSSFDDNHSPTFKEVASITKATIDFVIQIDEKLISYLDEKKYIVEVFDSYLNKQKDRKLFVATIKNFPPDKKAQKLQNIMKQYGIVSFNEAFIDLESFY